MELFKITCVTCKAKLSVRNREIIGQIIACPRCDSMVHVEAPAGGGSTVAATAVVAESVGRVAEQNVAEPPKPPSDFADVPDEVGADEVETAEPEQVPVDDIPKPAAALVTKSRLLAWMLTGVVGATLGGVVLFSRDGFSLSNSAAGSAEENAGSTEVTSQQESVAGDAPVEVPEKAASKTTDSPKLPNTEEPLSAVEKIAAEEEKEAVEIISTETTDADGVEQVVPLETTASQPQADVEPRIASRFDALDLDPDTLDLETLESAAGKQIVEQPTSVAPENVALQEDPLPALASTLPAVRRDPEQKPIEAPPQAEKLLAQRFQSLTVKAMPISDLLNLISRLGGVPISVAPQQLQMAGITSRQSVSLDAQEISLAEALQRVLKPLHLEYRTEGGQVVVVRQNAAKVRTIEYPLEDLLNSTTRLEDLVGWVEQLVVPAAQPPLGETVSLETSDNTLSIEQAQQFHYQVLIFFERLRLARKIPPRSRFPVKRLAGSSAYATLAERLRTQTTFTFSHYTSIGEIVRYWQQELGVPILVDWPALAELGFWPNSRIACTAENKPWSTALDQVLEPLGLGWRAVVGGAVEITSAEKVQTELQLEIYQLDRELAGQTERVLGELRGIAEKKPAAIAYDPAGKVLLVLQPAAAQRLVYQWLVDKKLAASD